MMGRRQVLKALGLLPFASYVSPWTDWPTFNRRHRTEFVLNPDPPARLWTIEQDGNAGGQYPPGSGDGPLTFTRLPAGGWQENQIALFQMHGNGNTYRHNSTDGTLGTLEPGVWCYGPQGNADDERYAGIASVVRLADGSLAGYVHQENFSDIGSIGLVTNADGLGYTWVYQGTILTGVDFEPTGFKGAMLPSVVPVDNGYVMLFENRFGNGRHPEIFRAFSPDGLTNWVSAGQAFPNDGDPHFHSLNPRLLFCEHLDAYVCFYQTDKAWRYRASYRRSSNNVLDSWGSAKTIQEWDQRYLNPTGVHTWYQTPLDQTKDDSMVFGTTGLMVEHRIDLANTTDRYPQWSYIDALP